MKAALLLAAALCAAPPARAAPPAPAAAPRRVLATGWDSPTPAQFRAGAAAFATLPFDGSVVKATRVLADGTTVGTSYAFEASSWDPAGFEAAVADLRAAPETLRRGSFLAVYANPGSVDFFDDAGWAQVTEHWRLLARTAKRGGLAGLMFDPEPYEKPWMQFRYRSQAGRKAHALDEYRAKARERGRAVMDAVASEFPDATVFCFRLLSDLAWVPGRRRADALLANEPFGLLPPFLDGWLDAAPATLTLIEGAESPGYRADSEADYARVAADFRARAPLLLAPESRAKWAARVRLAHAFYLDAYASEPGSLYHLDLKGYAPATRLERNAGSAYATADSGWLWMYGERARWWPDDGSGRPAWETVMPGAADALRRAKAAPSAGPSSAAPAPRR